MKSRPYLKKWKTCKKCIKEICKNIHANTNKEYIPLVINNFRFLADGVNFNIDVACMAGDNIVGHSISEVAKGSPLYINENLLFIFDYVLNDFKELQLEDAIKITNLRNKQLKFIGRKNDNQYYGG